ncbi:MAG: site-2 protease family protein [Candidatus Pacebacteria bacterium]|nr:site-2 protease family protein [Candidatus Paceibacterota bacterium]
MILTVIISFFILIGLIILHEFGHFILAKKFGVKVEEFGIGYPPRIWGKKIGETLYSLNFLPFGAFVKIYGHEERIQDARSYASKPIWQRFLIILGGVISFWIVAFVLLTAVIILGMPTVIEDSQNQNIIDPKVQILYISQDSPAFEAGLEIGDIVTKIKPQGLEPIGIDKVKEIQDITEDNKGKEIVLTIKRGKEILDIPVVPRVSPPDKEGPMGVGLVRTALVSSPLYQAPFKGLAATGDLTLTILKGWWFTLSSLLGGEGMPEGVEVRGVVGIFELFVQAEGLGLIYFLQFIAIISISLAILNIMPIPALDGGWAVLLILEKIKGRPISQKIEQNINSFFFILLISLMVWITIKDIARLF